MGNAISNVIEEREKKNEDTMKDALNVLNTMAEFKYEVFIERIKSTSDKNTVPIDQFINSEKKIVCSVSVDSTGIAEEVNDTLKTFCKGDIVDGISKIISMGIKGFLGQMSIGSHEDDKMLLILGEDGGILRLDYKMFGYTYSDKSLREVAKNVLMVCYTISSVNISAVHFDTIINLLQTTYSKTDIKTKAEIAVTILSHLRLLSDNPKEIKVIEMYIRRFGRSLENKDILEDLGIILQRPGTF